MIENQMVIGEYEPNWIDATDEDLEESAAEIESRVRNGELRQEFIDFIFDTDFVERTVEILLSNGTHLEIQEKFMKHLNDFSQQEAEA